MHIVKKILLKNIIKKYYHEIMQLVPWKHISSEKITLRNQIDNFLAIKFFNKYWYNAHKYTLINVDVLYFNLIYYIKISYK